MKYLLLTTSPFQLLNAIIYSLEDRQPSLFLVINENSYSSTELGQFEFLSNIFNVSIIKIDNKFWLGDYLEIKSFISTSFDCLIFGPNNHWSAFLAATLPIRKAVIVDDGAHSLSVFNLIEGRSIVKNLILELLADVFDYFISKKQVERLSLFNLETKYRLIAPDYKKLNSLSLTTKLDYSFSENSILFVGTPISEAGIITLETEVSSIAKARNFFNDLIERGNHTFLYVAHRRDSNEKLQKLCDLGIKILRLLGPLELYLAESLTHSEVRLCSLTSTVLFSAKNMGYRPYHISSFEVAETQFLKEYSEKYERIYKSFKESGFVIIS